MLCKVGMSFLGVSCVLLVVGVSMMLFSEIYFVEYVFGGGVWGVASVWIFDWLSVFFYFVVMMISGFIMMYSVDYMEGDCSIDRFVYLMVGFVLSMGLVVFSSNLFFMLFGWDGLGLVSYCLVIYYQNNRSFNAGMLTILSNRVGDVGLLGGIALLIGWGGLNYVEMVQDNQSVGVMVLGLLLLAGMTKSAQLPFSAWLPAAMAAPTPVSSLVHSSTLVAAGVYLMVRVGGFLGEWGDVLFIVGVLTMFMAGVGANYEKDLSSVVALSTLSQLGVMMMVVSLGEWELAYFHMVIHAMFKAMMFMCVGFVIHGVVGGQDVRLMGGMGGFYPLIGISLMVSGLALMGFPFMAGFYSSDLILESVMMWNWGEIGVLVIVLSFILTAMYSMSIFSCVLWGLSGIGVVYVSWEEGKWMLMSIGGLVLLSVFGGSALGWLLISFEEVIVLGWEKKMGFLIVVFGLVMSSIIKEFGFMMGDFFGSMWFLMYLSGNPVTSLLSVCEEVKGGDDLWGEVVGGKGVGLMLGVWASSMIIIQGRNLSGLLVLVCFVSVISVMLS